MDECLILGIGNPLCGDDGVGAAVVAALLENQHASLRLMTVHQLLPEHAELVARYPKVVFVDAMATSHRAAGELCVRRLSPACIGKIGSHRLSPEALMAVVNSVYKKAPDVFVIGIPASQFDAGAELSHEAAGAARKAMTWIEENFCRERSQER